MIFKTIKLKYGEEGIELRRKVTFKEFKNKYNNIDDKIDFKAELKSNENEIAIVPLVTLTFTILTLFAGEAIKKIINAVFSDPDPKIFDSLVYLGLLGIAAFMLILIIKSIINFSISKRCLLFIEEIEKEELTNQKSKIKDLEYLKKEYDKNIEILNLALAQNKNLTNELIEAKELSDVFNKKFDSKEIIKS